MLIITVNFDPSRRLVRSKHMAFKRPGNSRDDRSSGAPKRPAKGAGQTGRSSNSRYETSSSDKPGDRPKRNYSSREGDDEKKSFAPRRKPYSGRPEGGDDRPKRDYSN